MDAKMPGVSEALGVEELIRMMQTQADAMTCYASTLNYPPNTAAKWLNAGVERLRQQAERIAALEAALLLCNGALRQLSPCAAEPCYQDQRDFLDAALERSNALLGDSK